MDRFDAMQAFARVVETGSFTRAAETLRVNKASVTQQIQQLEAHLRVKLLNRTTRKVAVTADGAAYYERVLRILAELDDAETSLSTARASPRGRLRVDVPSPLARFVLVPALPGFHARHPDIQLDMGVSDRMVDLIGDSVDCVIRAGEITDPSLIARRVGELQFHAYAAPGYLERHGMPEHPGDLENPEHRVVGFLSNRSGRVEPFVMHDGSGEGVTVQGRHRVSLDDGNACLAAGLAGLGVLRLPTYMAHEHVARGELVRVLEAWHGTPQPLYLAYPPNRYVSAKLRAFVDWVVEVVGERLPASTPIHVRSREP
ncbi:LysR substrate-binding domain-containing protein [Hydrogenophaga sp. R2]|uniref:LysR family transcriptional regulator n=1 Tax=Hydrogenophaga sp. R2 TaxID=3132827 RepID=UPI003CF5CA50